jgi:hypothetical protein
LACAGLCFRNEWRHGGGRSYRARCDAARDGARDVSVLAAFACAFLWSACPGRELRDNTRHEQCLGGYRSGRLPVGRQWCKCRLGRPRRACRGRSADPGTGERVTQRSSQARKAREGIGATGRKGPTRLRHRRACHCNAATADDWDWRCLAETRWPARHCRPPADQCRRAGAPKNARCKCSAATAR